MADNGTAAGNESKRPAEVVPAGGPATGNGTDEAGGEKKGTGLLATLGVVPLLVAACGLAILVLTPLTVHLVLSEALSDPPDPKGCEESSDSGIEGSEGAHGKSPGRSKAKIMPMKMLILNIAGTKCTRLLRIEPHLVLSCGGLKAEFDEEKTARVVDKVIAIVGERSFEELDAPEGRQNLKRDIVAAVNRFIENKLDGVVVDVYFNEYLIQ